MLGSPSIITQASHGPNHQTEDKPDGNSQTTLTRDPAYEVFFRQFSNRRQITAYVGLDPSPWRSGDTMREQGISKAGNRRARHALIELAWMWLQWQPASELSQWFHARVGDAKGRLRRTIVVALARKLLIAIWRFLEHGVVPAGAVLRA
jgi:transposase